MNLIQRFANEEKMIWGILINVPKIIFTVFYLFFLWNDFSRWLLGICIFLVALSDYLDGRFVALKRSRVRRIANNVCDKIILNLITFATVLHFDLSVWYWAPFFLRDAIVTIGGSIILWRGKTVLFPHWFSKIALLLLAGLGISVVAEVRGWPFIAIWGISVVATCISLLDFIGIFIILRRNSVEQVTYYPKLFEGIRELWRLITYYTT